MKSVMMTADVHPFRAGTRYPMEDAAADILIKDGSAKEPQPWPEGAPAEARQTSPRKTKPMTPRRSGQGGDLLNSTYLTK